MILPFPDRPAQDIESLRAELQTWNEAICQALHNADSRMARSLRRGRLVAEEALVRAMERRDQKGTPLSMDAPQAINPASTV